MKQRHLAGWNFFLKGSALGCLFFCWALAGLLLTAEMVKMMPARSPEERLRRVTRINPFDAESWYALGKIRYYLGDYLGARRAYDNALTSNRFYYPAWIDLMWLALKNEADGKEASRLIYAVDMLNPTDLKIHWEILLKAITLDETWARDVALNEISLLIPLSKGRRVRLFRMAGMLLGSEDALLTFVPDDRDVKSKLLSYFLYVSKRPDLAETLWTEISARGWKTQDLFETMIKGLFYNKAYEKAWVVWRKRYRNDYKETYVFNGGFERNFLNYGFSWRYQGKVKGVTRVRFIHYYKGEGRRSFSMEFDGEHNPTIVNPYQYIYLEPGYYQVRALVSTKGVTGSNGFYVELSGPRFRAVSEEVKGDTPWKKIVVSVVLKQAGLYRLSLRRNASRKLNRFLGGRVFFDGVRLVRRDE